MPLLNKTVQHLNEYLKEYRKVFGEGYKPLLQKDYGLSNDCSLIALTTIIAGSLNKEPQEVYDVVEKYGVERSIEEIKRAAALGCRGFMVYDEGCLWLLNEMRKKGEIKYLFSSICNIVIDYFLCSLPV